MIRSFSIDNFKSLVDFRLPPVPCRLDRFTCLVGLNGAGKSTVLQALDFVGHLADGRVEEWLERRGWTRTDLTSRFLRKQLIEFSLTVEDGEGAEVEWSGSYNASLMRCTAESVRRGDKVLLAMGEQSLVVAGRPGSDDLRYPLAGLQYQGSSLSVLKRENLDAGVQAVMAVADNLRSLDMLTPAELRQRSRHTFAGTFRSTQHRASRMNDIGYGGERMSLFIDAMPALARERLAQLLREFFPQLQDFHAKHLKGGYRELRFLEEHAGGQAAARLDVPALHVSDGLLRVLAVLSLAAEDAQPGDEAPGCVLFDEIENGIHPELVGRLVKVLLRSRRQVIVTTHSPLILNYLPDDEARRDVLLVFRTAAGHTQAVRLFDLESIRKKLELLGPGEAYVDTDLSHLPREAEARLRAQRLIAS
jgi:energy-coupling factor transporter ATP-binding protein EcfA2